MKFTTCVLITLFAACIFFPACKKNNTTNAILILNIHNVFAQDSLVPGTTYKTSLGRNISFSRINYYISNISANTGNSIQTLSGSLLIQPQTGQYVVGPLAPGSYKSISFFLGIDTPANSTDPSAYSGSNPLAAQNPSMHFSSDSIGYIYMAVEGLYDSSAAGTGTPNVPFSYHIGTLPLLETVNMPDHSVAPYNSVFTATAGKLVTVDIESDLSIFMNNIDVKANPITNTSDYPVIADSLASHIPAMFVYQH